MKQSIQRPLWLTATQNDQSTKLLRHKFCCNTKMAKTPEEAELAAKKDRFPGNG